MVSSENEISQLRERITREFHTKYTNDVISVGDFTYGLPDIQCWDNNTRLTIGKFCSIASNVTFMLGGEHRTDWVTTYPFNALMECFSDIQGHPATKGDIIVGNDVWFAQGVRVLSGVTIGDGAVIGANSLVTHDIPPYAIVGGIPAKVIRLRFPRQTIKKLLKIQWWNWDDRLLAEAVPILQSQNMDKLFQFYEEKVTDNGKV